MFSLWNTTTKRQSFHHLHTVEEQQNRDENVVALIVFQVLYDPSSRFGHCLRPAKARTLEKFRPRFHLWFSLVEPFFSELYVWGRSYSGSHFDISTDFVRRHSLFGNFRLRHHFYSLSPPREQITYLAGVPREWSSLRGLYVRKFEWQINKIYAISFP